MLETGICAVALHGKTVLCLFYSALVLKMLRETEFRMEIWYKDEYLL